MKRKIDVTQEDIAAGVRQDGMSCPIARAIRRTTGKQWNVGVYTMAYHGHNASKCIVMPEACTEFVCLFDSACLPGRPEPFSFEFDDGEPESLTDYTEVLAAEPLVTEIAHEQVHCHHDTTVGADCQGVLAS